MQSPVSGQEGWGGATTVVNPTTTAATYLATTSRSSLKGAPWSKFGPGIQASLTPLGLREEQRLGGETDAEVKF